MKLRNLKRNFNHFLIQWKLWAKNAPKHQQIFFKVFFQGLTWVNTSIWRTLSTRLFKKQIHLQMICYQKLTTLQTSVFCLTALSKLTKTFTGRFQRFGKLTTNSTAKKSNFAIIFKAPWLQWVERSPPVKNFLCQKRKNSYVSLLPYKTLRFSADSTQLPNANSTRNLELLKSFRFQFLVRKVRSGNAEQLFLETFVWFETNLK